MMINQLSSLRLASAVRLLQQFISEPSKPCRVTLLAQASFGTRLTAIDFDPKSVIFRKNHKWQIVWSDFGFFLTIAGAAFWAYKRSFAEMALYWGIPYLWVNNWIVLITYLQHTDPTLRE